MLAYSEKDPTVAVILFEFPLEDKTTMGVDLINMKNKVNKEVLMKWIEKQPTVTDKSYITYSPKRERRRKMCD